MRIYFLGATRPAVPLTKLITPNTKESYPLTRYFTSFEEEIRTPLDMYKALKTHASQGHCLKRPQPLELRSLRAAQDASAARLSAQRPPMPVRRHAAG
jgi:hypothetical protein